MNKMNARFSTLDEAVRIMKEAEKEQWDELVSLREEVEGHQGAMKALLQDNVKKDAEIKKLHEIIESMEDGEGVVDFVNALLEKDQEKVNEVVAERDYYEETYKQTKCYIDIGEIHRKQDYVSRITAEIAGMNKKQLIESQIRGWPRSEYEHMSIIDSHLTITILMNLVNRLYEILKDKNGVYKIKTVSLHKQVDRVVMGVVMSETKGLYCDGLMGRDIIMTRPITKKEVRQNVDTIFSFFFIARDSDYRFNRIVLTDKFIEDNIDMNEQHSSTETINILDIWYPLSERMIVYKDWRKSRLPIKLKPLVGKYGDIAFDMSLPQELCE